MQERAAHRERAGHGAFDHTLHGAAVPTRVQWHFRRSSRLPVAVQTWELPPGGSEGLHRHPAPVGVGVDGELALEELYLVAYGTVTMQVGEVEYLLGPGDSVLAPVGVDHDLRNTGTDTARVVVVWGEPGTPVDWTRFGTGRAAARAADRADPGEDPVQPPV